MTLSQRQWRGVFALLLLAVALLSIACIDGSTVDKDAAQGLQMAINLRHHGILSEEAHPPLQPSMYREPVPILIEAVAVSIVDSVLGRADASEYFSGARAKAVKYLNVLWITLLALTVIIAARRFIDSNMLAIVAMLIAVRPYLSRTSDLGVNTLDTELLAALLLTAASYLLVRAQMRPRIVGYLLAGGCFGLLALTKASVLYAFAGVVLCVLVLGAGGIGGLRRRIKPAALVAAACAVIVVPWIARNAGEFGSPQISLRGGLALYTRALMDQISGAEYRGSFYAWAEKPLQPLLGKLLGFAPADLDRGGRLQRLNEEFDADFYADDLAAERTGSPEQAISFYRQARALRIRLQRQYTAAGVRFPDVLADGEMKRGGFDLIEHHPVQNAALAIPLIWRSGHWYFIVLWVALLFAWRGRRLDVAFWVLPSVTLLVFYALATPYLPRFTIIVTGVAAVALMQLIESALRSSSIERGIRGIGWRRS